MFDTIIHKKMTRFSFKLFSLHHAHILKWGVSCEYKEASLIQTAWSSKAKIYEQAVVCTFGNTHAHSIHFKHVISSLCAFACCLESLNRALTNTNDSPSLACEVKSRHYQCSQTTVSVWALIIHTLCRKQPMLLLYYHNLPALSIMSLYHKLSGWRQAEIESAMIPL